MSETVKHQCPSCGKYTDALEVETEVLCEHCGEMFSVDTDLIEGK